MRQLSDRKYLALPLSAPPGLVENAAVEEYIFIKTTPSPGTGALPLSVFIHQGVINEE